MFDVAVGFVASDFVAAGKDAFVLKVNQLRWVEGVAHHADLVVEVRTRRVTSATAQSDRIASFDVLILFNQDLGEVGRDGFKTIVVTNHYISTVTFGFVVYDTDFAGERGSHGVACAQANVDAIVIARATVAER